eukprot:422378-Amphidinium_carterae.1
MVSRSASPSLLCSHSRVQIDLSWEVVPHSHLQVCPSECVLSPRDSGRGHPLLFLPLRRKTESKN